MRVETAYPRKGGIEITADDWGGEDLWWRAQWLAVLEVNSRRTMYRQSLAESEHEAVASRFENHPDRRTVENWIAAIPPIDGAIKLHVEAEYKVIYFLAIHVLSEWQDIPKLAKREHAKLYREITAAVCKLRELMKQTGTQYIRGGGHGLDNALVCDFFTDKESENILGPIEHWNETHPLDIHHDNGLPLEKPPWVDFPSVDEVLERIASAADRLQDAGPIHSQPNKRGAKNGYFIRQMSDLLKARYGTPPDDVLGALASIALGEVVDADLAKKNRTLTERSKSES